MKVKITSLTNGWLNLSNLNVTLRKGESIVIDMPVYKQHQNALRQWEQRGYIKIDMIKEKKENSGGGMKEVVATAEDVNIKVEKIETKDQTEEKEEEKKEEPKKKKRSSKKKEE